MSELSGAESAAKQEQRPEDEARDQAAEHNRRTPGPPVTPDEVGAKEEADADEDRLRHERELTDPVEGSE
jgi:hypothetical protein